MNLDDIHAQFASDSRIDMTNYEKELKRFSELQEKYLKLLSDARRELLFVNRQMRTLKLERFKLYNEGPSKEHWKRDTQVFGVGMPQETVLKQHIPMYLDGDSDINLLQVKIDFLNNKIDILDRMTKSVTYKNNVINLMIQERNWREGD